MRICAIEVRNNPRYPYKPNVPLTILVNPSIEPLTDELFENYEGCLSVPNLRGVVERVTQIRVRAWDRDGNDFDAVIKGLTAGTFQHEVDHLHGKIFVDRVKDTRTLATWSDFERSITRKLSSPAPRPSSIASDPDATGAQRCRHRTATSKEHAVMRYLMMLVLVLVVAGCSTKPNPKSCLDNHCSDTQSAVLRCRRRDRWRAEHVIAVDCTPTSSRSAGVTTR